MVLAAGPALATGPRPDPSAKDPKIAMDLRAQLAGDPLRASAATGGFPTRGVEIEVVASQTSSVAARLTASGARIRGAVPGLIEADVPVTAIADIASRPDVRYVSPLQRPEKQTVSTEGLLTTSAATWQDQGIKGKGVKIGIIDGSFAEYPSRQAAGELPATVTTADFCGGQILNPANDGVHGTAVAEIVYDMAPEASLYLICIGEGLSALQSAASYAKTQGIRVVNFSAGYPASSRGDGRGGPSTYEGIVADAVASGITWVNAAGNQARRHWSGSFVGSQGGQWQEFAPGVDRQTFALPYLTEVCVYLKWDEWPLARSDYDVLLFGSDPANPVSGADRPSVGAEPKERFCYANFNSSEVLFHLGIWRASGTGTPRIDLFISGSALDNPVPAGSLVEPATVATVISVGAACWQGGTVDDYSSRGPTIDGRIAPDLLGPSEVTTATYGTSSSCSRSVGFPGTSSSAPHVAGAAALLLQKNPSFTPAQIRAGLIASASDRGAVGADNDYGNGLLNMGPVFTSGPCPSPRAGVPTVTNYLPNVTKTLGGPQGFTTPFIVQNSGTAPTDLEVEFKKFSDGTCVLRRAVPGLAAGASYAAPLVNEPLLPEDTQFSVVVRSFGAPIVSVVNEHQGAGTRAEAMSYVGFADGATTVWVPNVVRRFFGYHTPIIIQNLGNAAATVNARFVPFAGGSGPTLVRTIQPGQSQFIEPNIEAGLVDGGQYSATLTSPQPIAVVVNTHNDGPEAANPVAYSTDGLAAGSFAIYGAYAAKNANDSGRTGTVSTIVVQNVGANPVTPSIAFTPLGGGPQKRFTRATALAAGAAWVFDPRYTNGDTRSPLCAQANPQCLVDGEYSFVANAAGPIAGVVNVISPTSAMGYSAAVQPNRTVSLPNVTRTLGGPAGWSTPVILQSVTATSATLSWRSFRTGAVTPQTVALPAGGAVRIDPRNVPGLSDDTQYAVTVNGLRGPETGTISAMVIELADGADNAMAYEGFAAGPIDIGSRLVLTDLVYDGRIVPSESDEYVELQNQGIAAQDMTGWRITSVRGGQTYFFSSLVMQPGQICRLYTNEVHPEWCGLNWLKPTAQWNNTGDRANLIDQSGKVTSSMGYGGQ
jgi:subtilisin family serine protease